MSTHHIEQLHEWLVLNESTIQNSCSFSDPEEQLMCQLSRIHLFSKLDLVKGFHLDCFARRGFVQNHYNQQIRVLSLYFWAFGFASVWPRSGKCAARVSRSIDIHVHELLTDVPKAIAGKMSS